ncbi:MAG: DUF2934 domain-containing protein [Bryobacteraceae bacterium]|jgi:hypothetical protein
MRQGSEMGSDAAAIQDSAKTAATAGPTENEIATLAYRLWMERGCSHGSDQEDWFGAEAMLKNALAVKGDDLPGRPSVFCRDTRAQSEMLDEFASEIWQEGHWEVWEREWGGARWVSDSCHPEVGVSHRACPSGKAA